MQMSVHRNLVRTVPSVLTQWTATIVSVFQAMTVITVRKACKNTSQRLVRMVARAQILLPTAHVIVQRAFTASTASGTRLATNVPQAPANMAERVLKKPLDTLSVAVLQLGLAQYATWMVVTTCAMSTQNAMTMVHTWKGQLCDVHKKVLGGVMLCMFVTILLFFQNGAQYCSQNSCCNCFNG